MLRKILFSILSIISLVTLAQQAPAPKFAAKMQKAIVSVNTYDKDGKQIGTGTAFYIGKDGEAIADYQLFRGASKAVVIDQKGTSCEVDCILGADETYSIVRFKVSTSKNTFLPLPSTPPANGKALYAIPFSKGKLSTCGSATIESSAPFADKYSYFTLSADMGAEYVGAPLFSETGELVGIAQPAVKGKSCALDIRYANELKIAAFMPKSMTMALDNIAIEKGLPESMEEALVYTFFKSRNTPNDEYLSIINRFIATWPQNAEGYNRRSTVLMDMLRFDEADSDLNRYLTLATDKNTAHYNIAQSIFSKLQLQSEAPYDKWNYDLVLDHLRQSAGSKAELLKAQVYVAMKDLDAALAIYDTFTATDSLRTPEIYYAQSQCRELRGDSLPLIIAPMDSAIAMFGNPTPKEAASFVLRRGQLLANNGKYREAVLEYNRYCYLMNNKVNATFYYDRSQIEVNARMFQQALDDINLAVSASPGNAIYRIEKAAICLRVNMLDECIEACRFVTERTDRFPDAFRLLGYALLQQGDKDGALLNLNKAVELGDESAQEIINSYIKK